MSTSICQDALRERGSWSPAALLGVSIRDDGMAGGRVQESEYRIRHPLRTGGGHSPCPGRAGRLGHPCQHSQDWTLTHLLHLPAAPPALPLGEEVLWKAQPGQPNPNPSSLQGQILPARDTDLRQLDSGGGDK